MASPQPRTCSQRQVWRAFVGHLSIEMGGRIGSPLTTEECYPIFVRAVMRLLGFAPWDGEVTVPPQGSLMCQTRSWLITHDWGAPVQRS